MTGTTAIAGHLARTLGGDDADARLALALACEATQGGHTCADLASEAGWGPWAAELDAAARQRFCARLATLSLVGDANAWTPLVWDGRRLFLRRYWDYERRVAADLRARAQQATPLPASTAAQLAETFADAGQRAAAQIALTRRLCLISGGPGTGKTTTLARIIGLLRAEAPALRIRLAAPTGKAAARMSESLAAAGVKVEDAACTVHRLLGMRSDGSGYTRHRERPLACDLLVVDEASMIDLSLMAHLLDALPPDARLVLLGDRDQLAAVEAGAVFADLCASPALCACVVSLTTSFRFGAASGIGRLATALRQGDAPGALRLLEEGADDLHWQAQARAGGARAALEAARAGYADYLQAVAAGLPPQELFERFMRFRVLCAHRQDVATINDAFLPAEAPRPPLGTPVMVLKNDPLLRLFNGDIGLILADPADGARKACFQAADAALRWVPLARLPQWEPAWAMTVHKSQGSEFEQVLLYLPAAPSAVVTRELVYTGITRAKRRVELWASPAVLQAAIGRRAERMSGLRERLG
ncbi:MAG: exodeoxyribonuclease V subunit alpha [Rhodocyclaceae bacterium]|nr:exodeoxyribonuclease V subunit alpha [Rhodocyclaceae bacterium]